MGISKSTINFKINLCKLLKNDFYRNLSEDEKCKKVNYANIGNKNMSDADREINKEYMKKYYYKRKKLSNHLIHRIEELENVLY